jgi:hypothetical protein
MSLTLALRLFASSAEGGGFRPEFAEGLRTLLLDGQRLGAEFPITPSQPIRLRPDESKYFTPRGLGRLPNHFAMPSQYEG